MPYKDAIRRLSQKEQRLSKELRAAQQEILNLKFALNDIWACAESTYSLLDLRVKIEQYIIEEDD